MSLDHSIIRAGRKASALETRSEQFLRIWFNKLSQFSRIINVTKKDNIKVNITTRLFLAMMVGYSENSVLVTYHFYNPKTNRPFLSRVEKWIGH